MIDRRPSGGNMMDKLIECPCGAVFRSDDDEELVTKVQTHAAENHQMDLSREQALEMARPA